MSIREVRTIQSNLTKLPEIKQIPEVTIQNKIINHILVEHSSLGNLTVSSLQLIDSDELFNFYFQGISETARIFFCPYPLFNPRPNNSKELANSIKSWRKEKDWTVLKMVKDRKIIGVCLLKKYATSPTSGVAVHEDYQRKGLGILLQTIVNEQAILLGLKELVITLAPNNNASLKLHQKAGFKQTGRLIPHFTYVNGIKKIDRDDIEMVIKFIK